MPSHALNTIFVLAAAIVVSMTFSMESRASALQYFGLVLATFFDLPTEKQQTNGNPRAAKPRQPRAAGRSAGAPGAPKADDVPGQPSLAVDRLNAQLSSTWSRRPGAAIPSLGGPLVRPRWLFGETRGTKVRAARPEAPQPARAEVNASRAELSWHLGRLCAERRGAARLISLALG